MNVSTLKNLNIERVADVDEMVAMHAFGESLQATYEKHQMPIPEWLPESLRILSKEIASHRRDSIERALKLAKSRFEALKSADEKRKDLQLEIERLTASLT